LEYECDMQLMPSLEELAEEVLEYSPVMNAAEKEERAEGTRTLDERKSPSQLLEFPPRILVRALLLLESFLGVVKAFLCLERGVTPLVRGLPAPGGVMNG